MTTENTNNTNQGNEGNDKLYAGKFKTVEELEAGYKNSLPTFQENEQLKSKLAEATSVPQNYLKPNDITIDEKHLSNLQTRAKEAGLTQVQYEKMLRHEKSMMDAGQTSFENMRKEVGEETLNILKDYVGKNYPKELQDGMINSFIVNKEARQAALNHRSQLLNSQTPGVNKPAATGYTITDEDVRKAYVAKEKAQGSHKLEAQQRYLNLLAARAEQKSAG